YVNPPELRPVAVELPLCQRYYFAVSNYQLGINLTPIFCSNGDVPFPTQMRATPTVLSSAFTASAGSNGTTSAGITSQQAYFSNAASNWSNTIANATITLAATFGAEL